MEQKNKEVNVFARIGATLELTEEEITEFLSRYDELNEQERGAILRNAFLEGRVTIGGDTYIPVPSIDDVNDELGTDYEPGEYEFQCPDNAKILLEKQAPEENEKTVLRGGDLDPAVSLQKFIEKWTVKDDASTVKPAEERNHNLEVTCELTMRESHMVTVGDEAYDMIKEGNIDAVRYLFGKTFMDCISDPDGTKTDTETDYAVYDCDTEMQVIDWD